jgi:predicted CXXCH cytochrome family protein
MNIRSITILAAAAVILLAPAIVTAAQRDPGKPAAGYPLPEIKKDCTICHLPAGTHKPEELKKQLSQLCLDCHRDRKAPAEHKVDMVPAMPVKGLPLTNGKMTCVTCHDPHANVNGNMLRMGTKALCLVCHPK